MIVAERKPLPEIIGFLKDARRILVAGCSECVTVCQAGGQREVEVLASLLRLHFRQAKRDVEIKTATLNRQCDPEFLEEIAQDMEDVDTIVSMGCGVGVQFLSERYRSAWVVPALDTKFGGGAVTAGQWEERCGFCGQCILHLTGGICPIIRCSKSLLNGPCGGSSGGKCEVSKETDCAWQLIYDRLKELGKLWLMMEIIPPKDWSRARDGGPRRVRREDVAL
ncbi:MAG: methylenetetrahydrofolate reductase C-terminal domain-containing protein [Bacillota bacterium]